MFKAARFLKFSFKKEPIEALFRSMLLVLMDNGSSEFAFISRFFDPNSQPTTQSPISDRNNSSIPQVTVVDSGYLRETPLNETLSKEKTVVLEKIWKQIFDPVLEYCQVKIQFSLSFHII